MSGTELARVRAALDQAEADVGWPAADAMSADRQRRYAEQNEASASRLDEAGFPELAATYRETARQHEATAARIEREERP